jgi:hypothetical protein
VLAVVQHQERALLPHLLREAASNLRQCAVRHTVFCTPFPRSVHMPVGGTAICETQRGCHHRHYGRTCCQGRKLDEPCGTKWPARRATSPGSLCRSAAEGAVDLLR